jgi:hypothetical protein
LVNARILAVLVLAVAVLTATAALRSSEYDEQYTMFLTAGVARPDWPGTSFPAGDVQAMQSGQASLGQIARDLRRTDVHPPVYFWAVALWRRAVGGGLFRARMFSVLCSLAALAAVGVIARSAGIPPALPMLLTLGCYGFAYTSAIARGFALAQMLSVGGVALLMSARGRRGWAFAGGAALGAATAANYLAVFVAAGALLAAAARNKRPPSPCGRGLGGAVPTSAPPRMNPPLPLSPSRKGRGDLASSARLPPAITGAAAFALFLPLDLSFFLPQRNARTGQFPPFHLLDSLQRLARYAAANVVGGLPRYADGWVRALLAATLTLFVCVLAGLVAVRWRRMSHLSARRLLAAATVAPPIGLLVLGAVFHNTPIELRYLAFAVPFAATLLAGALASLPRRVRRTILPLILLMQAASIAGLLTRPETMQPARATAAAAAGLARGGIVLLPHGNDGVGIVGAFAIEAPPELRLLVIDRGASARDILARIGARRRVVLALLAQDESSRATVPLLRETFATACWHRAGQGFNVVAYDSVCEEPRPPLSAQAPSCPGRCEQERGHGRPGADDDR